MEKARTYNCKPCRVSKIQVGTTLFTVISVESTAAKETAYEKVKKLIMNNANSSAKSCVDYYPKV